MEPTSHGAAGNRSPLRRSPLRNQIGLPPPSSGARHQFSEASPLRRSSPTSTAQKHLEDQRYEQRRQEELRRQIRQKELELEQISSQKQRFKERIDRTLGLPQGSATQFGSLNSRTGNSGRSPLRHDNRTRKPYDAVAGTSGNSVGRTPNVQGSEIGNKDSFERERFAAPRGDELSVPKITSSPLRRGDSRSNERKPFRDYQVATVKQTPSEVRSQRTEAELTSQRHQQEPAFAHSGNEYAQQLHSDNAQLQRRLNLVIAELDRVKREMASQRSQLDAACFQREHLERAIEAEDHTDDQLEELRGELIRNKDSTANAQTQIHSVDARRQEAVQQLRAVQGERDRRRQDYENLSENHRAKVQLVKGMETEILSKQHQLEVTERELDLFARRASDESREVNEVHAIVSRLQRERDDLMAKLETLNRNYDSTVVEISRERAQLESHNKRHTQLLTSKVIVNLIEVMIAQRKQAALNEFFAYCTFDEKCHTVLRKFSAVLERCGQYQMRIGLQQWYQNGLKPVATIAQSAIASEQLDAQKILTRNLQIERQKLEAQDQVHGKLDIACKRIWAIKQKDVVKELARYFTIWRDRSKLAYQQQKAIFFLACRQHNAKKAHVFRRWQLTSLEARGQVRLYVLRHSIAQKQLMTITLHQLRTRVAYNRRKRLNRLAHLWKGWRSWIDYKRYMMAQIVTTSTMRSHLDTNLLKQCFDTMKHHKEASKYELMTEKLTEDTEPAISQLTKDIETEAVNSLRQHKKHAMDTLSRMARAKLASYFHYWTEQKDAHAFKVRKNFKELLCRRYNATMHQAFNYWLQGRDTFKKNQQVQRNGDLVEEGSNLQDSNLELGRQIETEDNGQDRSKRTSLRRSSNIWTKRMLTFGFRRWANRVRDLKDQEQAASFVKNFIRKSLCQQAWDLYLQKVKALRQEEFSQSRADFFAETLRMRKQRKFFNAFCQFLHNSDKQKTYSTILLQKIDFWMKKKAFHSWQDNRNVLVSEQKQGSQNENTDNFDDLTHQLREVQNEKSRQTEELDKLKKEHRSQAEKSVGNNFVRMYHANLRRSFDKWSAAVRSERHREEILKRTVKHWEHYRFYAARAAWDQWIAKCKHTETTNLIGDAVRSGDDHASMNQHRREQHVDRAEQLKGDLESTDAEANELDAKLSNTVTTLIKRGDDYFFQSRLRFILLQWAAHAKRQKRFASAITNVILKSLSQQGFDNVSAFARDKQQTRDQNRALVGMKRMFFRKLVGEWFSHWKGQSTLDNVQESRETEAKTDQMVQKHARRVLKIQDFNCERTLRQMTRLRMKNYWRGWCNVNQWLKTKRAKTQAYIENHDQGYHAARALKKWHERKTLTQRCRDRFAKFRASQRLIYLKAAFEGVRNFEANQRRFCSHLRQAAEKLDHYLLQDSFQVVRNFALSKQYHQARQRRHAASDMASALHQLYLTRMAQSYSHLRIQVYEHRRKRDTKIAALFGYCHSRRVREIFCRWRSQAHFATVVIDVNERGPIVEEVLQWKQELENTKQLMTSEGYELHQVQDAAEGTNNRQRELMARSIARLKRSDQEDDSYLLPVCFDRWREFVKVRKLVGYMLNFMENKMQPLKADLQHAFHKWKNYKDVTQRVLGGTQRNEQKTQFVHNQHKLRELTERAETTEEELAHMGMQRDELIDNYMKAQRLALALGRDNRLRGLSMGLTRLSDGCNHDKKTRLEDVLRDNLQGISHLKDKIQEFEEDNESIAAENEELRQFSLDGYQIAKNVQSLGAERERLSVDLADKTNTIKKLLDENSALQLKLKQAQDNAQRLIHMSNQKMAQMRQAQYV